MDFTALLAEMQPMLAVLPIAAVIAIISLVSSIAMAVYAYQQRPGDQEGVDGSKFGLRRNRAAPGAPSPLGGGKARWAPPLMSRTLTQPNLNSLGSYDAKPMMRLLLDTGIGPYDGGDLRIWLDDTPIFEVVSLDSPFSERVLQDVSNPQTLLQWFFPKNNVQERDARIYLDGDIYGVTEGDSFEGIDSGIGVETTNSPARAARQLDVSRAKKFLLDDDDELFAFHSYIDLPSLAWHYRERLTVEADLHFTDDRFTAANNDYGTASTGLITLTKDMYTVHQLKDGKLRVWLTEEIETLFTDAVGEELGLQKKAKSIKVAFPFAKRGETSFTILGHTVTLDIPCEVFSVVTDPKTFRSKAVFKTAVGVAGQSVTATYKTLPFGVTVKTFFTHGDLDQEPIPIDFLGQSRAVNQRLAQAVARRYITTVPVDNATIGIASGQSGFFSTSNDGIGNRSVDIRIRYKYASAPDTRANSFGKTKSDTTMPDGALDPASGWIPLRIANNDTLRIHSRTTGGIARWAFRLSDAWKDNLLAGGAAKAFVDKVEQVPRQQYEFEVIRVTTDDPGGSGASETHFESVTENVWESLSFPRRSFLLVEYEEQEGLDATPEVEVQFKMRKCRIYEGTFTVSRAEQLGRWIAENSKPTQITLSDGTVLTTGGALLDPTQFVHDPLLAEPRFRTEWTRNPVWIATEFIIDEVTGGGVGGYDSRESVDWESALRAANYCDEIVDWVNHQRNTTQEVRSEADIVFTARLKLYDCVARVLAGSGVAPSFSRGKWFFPIDDDSIDPPAVIDKLTGSAFVISDDDILDAEDDSVIEGLSFESKENETIATDLEITFPDQEAGFDQDADPVFIPANEDTLVRNVRRASFPAVRRRSQVERTGNQMMLAEENNRRLVSMRPANFRTIILDPGDIVLFGSETAKLTTRKAQVIERVTGGTNLRQDLRLLLLDGSERVTNPEMFQGPSGGIIPGLRQPLDSDNTGNLASATSGVQTTTPSSGIIKVEEL